MSKRHIKAISDRESVQTGEHLYKLTSSSLNQFVRAAFLQKPHMIFFFHPILSNHDKVSVLRLLGYDSPFHLLLDI